MLNSCYLYSSVAIFLYRNPDQHANRKIGSDAAVCPEETSLFSVTCPVISHTDLTIKDCCKHVSNTDIFELAIKSLRL